MAKRVDPLAAKKAKQKKLAIGLCVLLAGVVAFQGPKMLKMMKGPAATAEAAPVAPARHDAGTVPDPAAPATPAVPVQEAVLADSDVAPDAESGQLISIDSFSTKDPFEQQLTEAAPSVTPAPANDSAPPSTPATDTPSSGAPAGHLRPARLEPAGSGSERAAREHHAAVEPPATAAETTISINGATESVAALAEFPAADPVFVLESLAADGKSALDQRGRRQLHQRQADDQAADRQAADAAEHLGREPLRPRAPDGRGLRPAEEVEACE